MIPLESMRYIIEYVTPVTADDDGLTEEYLRRYLNDVE